jgi:hypothetical protein
MAHEMQSVVTQTTPQTEIPSLMDSWARNTVTVKMLCPQKIAFHIFAETQHISTVKPT